VELGDVIANGAGVSCGALLGLPIRACVAIPVSMMNSAGFRFAISTTYA